MSESGGKLIHFIILLKQIFTVLRKKTKLSI